MLDARDDCGLRIAPPPCAETTESPACGLAAVGTDHKPAVQDTVRVEACRDMPRTAVEGGNTRMNNRLWWCQSAQSVQQGVDQRRVGDIQAELRQADIAGLEDNFRGPDQITGIVQQPDRAEGRCGIRGQSNVEVPEKPQRGLKQRESPRIERRLGPRWRGTGQSDGVTRQSQANRAREADGTAAGNQTINILEKLNHSDER